MAAKNLVRCGCPGPSTSLKRPRPTQEGATLREHNHSRDCNESVQKAVSGIRTPSQLASASTPAASATPQLEQGQQQRYQGKPLTPYGHHRPGDGGRRRDSISLPWLPDRFYLNVLVSMREDDDSREDQGGTSECQSVEENGSSSSSSSSSSSHSSDGNRLDSGGDVTGGGGEGRGRGGGGGYSNGPLFSLPRLVKVVTGDGWPGIKAAIFGTFSLDIGRMAEEIPCLFSTSNRTVPVLILHGDKTLRRRRLPRQSTSPEPAGASKSRRRAGEHEEEKRQGCRQPEEAGGVCVLEDYAVWRKGLGGRVSRERWDQAEATGRLDRLADWELRMSGHVQVEQVQTGTRGVHHPKFGLLFLNDGTLVVYVGTGNMGVDTAIDATWVQRFDRLEKAGSVEGSELPRPTVSSRDDSGSNTCTTSTTSTCNKRTTWEGDFANTLQGFLQMESWLIEKDCVRPGSSSEHTKQRRQNTPEKFMLRELGIQRLGECFDFSTAAVDLIPTAPVVGNGSKPFTVTQQRQQHNRHPHRRHPLHNDKKRHRQSSPSSSPPPPLSLSPKAVPSDDVCGESFRLSSSRGACNDDGDADHDEGDTADAAVKEQGEERDFRAGGDRRHQKDFGAGGGGGGGGDGGGGWTTNKALMDVSDIDGVDNLPRGVIDGSRYSRAGECTGGVRGAGVVVGGASGRPDVGGATEGVAPASTLPVGRSGTEEVETTTAAAAEDDDEMAQDLLSYGQLRMRYVLRRRRNQVGNLGPRDLLILQPTSIGGGVDTGFIEVVAKNLMPDSLGTQRKQQPQGAWTETESRVYSVRIVWPSMQYMDACRIDMSKSKFRRERQAAAGMEVDQTYVMGQSDKRSDDDGNGFVFMSPDIFDLMGTDLHACLKTFQLHPSVATLLPPRPAHIKSAMRLRKAPPLKQPSSRRQRQWREEQQQQQQQHSSTFSMSQNDSSRNLIENESRSKRRTDRDFGAKTGTTSRFGVGFHDEDGNNGVCEDAQHFAWFLLTSACLSKGAQGEVTHRAKTGEIAGVEFKNVELGVLFHSSPQRAYHAAPPADCACSPCRLHRSRAHNSGHGVPQPSASLLRPQPIPLPVPFCLDSEAYADPDRGSPHVRFPPYMHTLKGHRPWSVEVQRLLTSQVQEAQFSSEC